MKNKYPFSFLIVLILCFQRISAQDLFIPQILSFEETSVSQNWSCDSNSEIGISRQHYKHGKQSMRWDWNKNSALVFKGDINFKAFDPNSENKSIPTFCFWVYNETPKNENIKIQFGKDGNTNCWFEFGLNFKGWRAAWVAFERDMQGTPAEGMNRMSISAPENASGSLFFDHIMLCTPADSRWNTPDYQVPFVNAQTENHWLILYKSSLNKPIEKLESLTEQQTEGIQTINRRYSKEVIKKQNVNEKRIAELKKAYDEYQIVRSDDQISGKVMWFCRFSEIYEPYTKEWKNYFVKYEKDLANYTNVMYNIACAYQQTENTEYKNELEELFFNMSDHLIDQGWAEGSANGTLHHLGYSMRTYYSAYFLMRESLIRTQRAEQAQKAMEWYSGAKEVFAPMHEKGMSIDAFNTSVMGRLASILMLEDSPEKVRYLNAYVKWIDNGLAYAPGLKDSFKVDGSVFHHANNYPAYANGGFDGATLMVYFFSQTPFSISEQGHANLKQSLLKTRLFCNKETWPLSMSGRHPNGKGKLSAKHYERMALSGSPDGKDKTDAEMAAVYLRLQQGKKADSSAKRFKAEGFEAENDPNGNWTMNYAALGIHRRSNWSATVQGHSRYLWAAEHYIGANYYGRYLKHGQLQIISGENKPSVFTSGFNANGWDWGRFAGTTAIHLPIEQLRANILNVDQVSGYEEMLISDEAFAGAISMEGQNGAWAMKLHEHDKYNGSHRATKSVFFFDNRIICLGSNIENTNADYNTETTLFQNYLNQESENILFNNLVITEFPFSTTSQGKKASLLTDNVGNSFYIPAAYRVEVSKQQQFSKDQKKETPNQGNFATAVINHGKAPQAASYEYAILVQSSHNELVQFARQMNKKKTAAYTVLQQDKKAHIVRDNASKTTAFALFEANTDINQAGLTSVNAPALVMIKDKKNSKVMSLCDPDLHLYEGSADIVLENGKRKERSIYSRDWIYNESKVSKIQVKLKGEWTLEANDYCRLISSNENESLLEFTCQHGLTREVVLNKK
ncbi:chondroitinase family polysaccharide lyase [Labilibaculum sp.]|uniref:chondroitinase family polysaccharide lyase n=1 Tax=Labilibaculum sp. TaxID=2060723 RepID=UPI002AA8650F|nr:chondroitinase family polysaccharide lyase [Labilibaculum sp.]